MDESINKDLRIRSGDLENTILLDEAIISGYLVASEAERLPKVTINLVTMNDELSLVGHGTSKAAKDIRQEEILSVYKMLALGGIIIDGTKAVALLKALRNKFTDNQLGELGQLSGLGTFNIIRLSKEADGYTQVYQWVHNIFYPDSLKN